MAIEGEAREEHVLVDGQLVVVGRVREVCTRAVVVVFGQLLHVVGVVAAIDRRAVGAGGEVAVHHAVGDAHTRGVDRRGAADGALVAAHDAGGIVTAADAGIVVAIHHADVGVRSNQSHQSAGIGRAADAAAQHAAVVDLCGPRGGAAYGAHRLAGDADVLEADVLHRAAVQGREERGRKAADGVVAAVEGTAEGGDAGSAGGITRQAVVAVGIRDF